MVLVARMQLAMCAKKDKGQVKMLEGLTDLQAKWTEEISDIPYPMLEAWSRHVSAISLRRTPCFLPYPV